jgi:hypothetical protein
MSLSAHLPKPCPNTAHEAGSINLPICPPLIGGQKADDESGGKVNPRRTVSAHRTGRRKRKSPPPPELRSPYWQHHKVMLTMPPQDWRDGKTATGWPAHSELLRYISRKCGVSFAEAERIFWHYKASGMVSMSSGKWAGAKYRLNRLRGRLP